MMELHLKRVWLGRLWSCSKLHTLIPKFSGASVYPLQMSVWLPSPTRISKASQVVCPAAEAWKIFLEGICQLKELGSTLLFQASN